MMMVVVIVVIMVGVRVMMILQMQRFAQLASNSASVGHIGCAARSVDL